MIIGEIRLNKFISDSGFCSRREADKYIEKGQVIVNGKRAKVGDIVLASDKVMVSGLLIEGRSQEELILMAFNKPVGVVSTTEIGVKDSIVDYIGYHERIFPIGRLDKDSQGLIFMTNNGDIVNKILRAGNKHEKEYVVTVNKPITSQFIAGMSNGVPILGETTKKCVVKKESTFVFKIILVQGLNRQIRRMCEYFGYEVVKLERIRIMNINLKGLPLGEWRMLTDEEQRDIEKAISNSSSTHKHKVDNPSSEFSKRNRKRPFQEKKKDINNSDAKQKSAIEPKNDYLADKKNDYQKGKYKKERTNKNSKFAHNDYGKSCNRNGKSCSKPPKRKMKVSIKKTTI